MRMSIDVLSTLMAYKLLQFPDRRLHILSEHKKTGTEVPGQEFSRIKDVTASLYLSGAVI